MRALITLALVAACLNLASAQFNLSLKERLHRNWPIYTSLFVAGAADGLEESIEHHWYIVERKFPNINHRYWNPEVSWENKWKDGNPDLGPAYFGSTNFLVWTTDAYHLIRLVKHTSYSTAICYSLYKGAKTPDPTIWDYLLDFAIGSAFRTAGYYLVYRGVF